jgi:hypothetical protein
MHGMSLLQASLNTVVRRAKLLVCVCVCVCVDLSKERPRSCRRLRHALLIHGSVSEVRAIACP